MISAYKGHTDVVEFLLSNGADPDQQALCGATALHYAAECGHVDICAALLDYGATLKRNEFDMTAVTTAAERTRELVVELFYGRANLLTKEEVDALRLLDAVIKYDRLQLHWSTTTKFERICIHLNSLEFSPIENRCVGTNGSIICKR